MPGERDRGQPQARRPSLRALVEARQRRHPRARSPRPRAGPSSRPAEKRRSVPRSSVSSPASRRRCRASCGVLAGCQHDAQRRAASAARNRSSHAQRVDRAKLVQVVDHQHGRLLQRAEVGQQLLDHRLALEGRRRIDPLAPTRPLRRARRSRSARTAARPARPARPTPSPPGPRAPSPRSTSAAGPSCRCRPARRPAPPRPRRARQPLEQPAAMDHPSSGNDRRRAGLAGWDPSLDHAWHVRWLAVGNGVRKASHMSPANRPKSHLIDSSVMTGKPTPRDTAGAPPADRHARRREHPPQAARRRARAVRPPGHRQHADQRDHR